MGGEEGLPSKPRVPRYFYIVPMTDDRIQLRSARRAVLMSGSSVKAVTRMLSLLDGTREVPQILGCFPEIPEEQVLRTLRTLFDKGLIEDAAIEDAAIEDAAMEDAAIEEAGATEGELAGRLTADNEAQETFFSMVSHDKRLMQGLLGRARVVVFGLGRVGAHAVASMARAGVGRITGIDDGTVDSSLPNCGGLYLAEDTGRARVEAAKDRVRGLNRHIHFEPARVSVAGENDVMAAIHGADLVLVCQDSPAVSVYRSVNRAALQERVRWLRVSLEGFEAQLGPCVLPYETACYNCYELRAKGNWLHYDENLAFEEYLASGPVSGPVSGPASGPVSGYNPGRGETDYGCLAPTSGFLGNLAALEALKLLTGFSYPITCGQMWTFNINTFDARRHVVLKLPRCPSCGAIVTNPGQAQWAL